MAWNLGQPGRHRDHDTYFLVYSKRGSSVPRFLDSSLSPDPFPWQRGVEWSENGEDYYERIERAEHVWTLFPWIIKSPCPVHCLTFHVVCL